MGEGDDLAVGDKAVYPGSGIVEVCGVVEESITGASTRFYVLRILATDRKILVPVSSAPATGLRRVIGEDEIRSIFGILREPSGAFDNQSWNRRYRGFYRRVKSGSLDEVVEVLRDLHRLQRRRALSFGDRRLLDKARLMVVAEIAVARGQAEPEVKSEVEAAIASGDHPSP
jgi:CarD family transcriptional regulator